MSIKPESSLWLVGRYLKDRLKILLAFGLFILLFFLVYLLYNLPWEAALYGALLCLCAGTVFGAYDLYQYVQKHQKLSLLRQAVAYGLEQLPEPQSLAELDYRELLEHRNRDQSRGHSPDFRAGLYRLQRAHGQKIHRDRAVFVPADHLPAGARH